MKHNSFATEKLKFYQICINNSSKETQTNGRVKNSIILTSALYTRCNDVTGKEMFDTTT